MLLFLGQACPKQAHMARLNSSVETVGSGGGDLGCHKTAAKIIRKLIKKRTISDTKTPFRTRRTRSSRIPCPTDANEDGLVAGPGSGYGPPIA